MRLQLTLALLAIATPAFADDRAEVSTSLFAEKRDGNKGGLTVVHPQADFGIDLGRFVSLDAAYSADAVSGATSVIYQADAVSSATSFSDVRHEGRHRARLPVASDRRQRVDRSARPQHHRRPRVQP